MEYRRHSNGSQTFLENWGLLLLVAITALASQLFSSLARLHGGWWLGLCACGFAAQIVGAMLIGYAKLPLYHSRRYFTFGLKHIPAHRAGHYRWGWRVFLLGVMLSLGLLMGRL